MRSLIPVIACAEDKLLASITERLFTVEFGDVFCLEQQRVINAHGKSKLDAKVQKWNRAAKNREEDNCVFFLLRDTDCLAYPEDETYCPETEIARLLDNQPKHSSFLFRLAVAEGENWLLADFENLCKFLKVKGQSPSFSTPDAILQGKEKLKELIGLSTNRSIWEGMSSGGEYNEKLQEFVMAHWQPWVAQERSKSLRRMLARLDAMKPQ